MEDKFLLKLKEKYNYNDKVLKAIGKILPILIDYYGEENESLIKKALLSVKIITCSSKETLSKYQKENTSHKKIVPVPIINIKSNEGLYISDPKLKYDSFSNSYQILNIDRKIIIAHTFNLDSPKGLEVLTYFLCNLIKSYYKEYEIKDNTLTKRNGLSTSKYNIINDKEIFLEMTSSEGSALEQGINLYDTEKIVSAALNTKYNCYDYHSIYTIGYILKEKFNMIDKVNEIELYSKQILDENLLDLLKEKSEECLFLENEMLLSMFRKEKDELSSIINKKMSFDIYRILIGIYENEKEKIMTK